MDEGIIRIIVFMLVLWALFGRGRSERREQGEIKRRQEHLERERKKKILEQINKKQEKKLLEEIQ